MKTTEVCPYLHVQKTAQRLLGEQLSRTDHFDVETSWYCTHPFHGIPVQIGESKLEAEERCATCTLRPGGEGSQTRTRGPRKR